MQNQEKEILIDEILDLLGTNQGARSSVDSLRISQDYDPNNFRYTKDELEQIQFEFMEEDEDANQQIRPNFKKTQNSPSSSQQIKSKVERIEGNNKFEQQASTNLAQKLRKKNSLKMGQVIKKKRSEKETVDEFTKKYDNLFDQVFNQEKKKIEKEEQKLKQPTKPTIQMQWQTNTTENKPIQMQWSTDRRKEESQNVIVSSDKHSKIGQKQWLQKQLELMKQTEVEKQMKNEKKNQKITILRQNKTNQADDNFTINVYDDRNKKQLSESLVSNTSISSAPSFTILPDVISRQSFQELTKKYSDKPHLIQAFKPKIQVNYEDKKQIMPMRVNFTNNHITRTAPFSLSSSHAQGSARISPISNTQTISPNKNEQPHIFPGKAPAVKFSYGGSSINTGVSSRPLSPQSQTQYHQPQSLIKKPNKIQNKIKYNTIKEQCRLPIFLRRLRQLTNSYPNFYSGKAFIAQNVQKFNLELKQSFKECRKAINTLKHTHLMYHELIKIVKQLYTKMSKNVQQKRSQQDKELIEYFINNDWKSVVNFIELQKIKPHDLFQKRVLNQLEFMTLLNSYEQLIDSIDTEDVIKIGIPLTIKTYMDYRDKIWAIEKNLRIMSEDFYLKAIIKIHLPQHIIDSYQIIKDGKAKSIEEKNRVLDCLTFLQEKKDIFAQSYLGRKTINLLLTS